MKLLLFFVDRHIRVAPPWLSHKLTGVAAGHREAGESVLMRNAGAENSSQISPLQQVNILHRLVKLRKYNQSAWLIGLMKENNFC